MRKGRVERTPGLNDNPSSLLLRLFYFIYLERLFGSFFLVCFFLSLFRYWVLLLDKLGWSVGLVGSAG